MPALLGLVVRDILDIDLQTDPRLVFLLVGIGLAFLLTLIAFFCYLYPVWPIVRRLFGSRVTPQNPAVTEMFKPLMTSTPRRKSLTLPHRQKFAHPIASLPKQSPTDMLQKHTMLWQRPVHPSIRYALHNVPPPIYQHSAFRSNQPPAYAPPPATEARVSVLPHVAGWMKVADTVVGRHPFAKPLSERLATQAEIDLIGGHVHIPWAFRPSISRPIPVKVLKPITVQPPLAMYPDPKSNATHYDGDPLMEKSALGVPRKTVDDPTAPAKAARGKENTPALLRTGRRNRLDTPSLI